MNNFLVFIGAACVDREFRSFWFDQSTAETAREYGLPLTRPQRRRLDEVRERHRPRSGAQTEAANPGNLNDLLDQLKVIICPEVPCPWGP